MIKFWIKSEAFVSHGYILDKHFRLWTSLAFAIRISMLVSFTKRLANLCLCMADSRLCPCSYVNCIMMTPYLINLNAVSVEMDFILQLDPIGLSFSLKLQHLVMKSYYYQNIAFLITWFHLFRLSNLLRIFSHGVGSAEGVTIEASKSRNRLVFCFYPQYLSNIVLSQIIESYTRNLLVSFSRLDGCKLEQYGGKNREMFGNAWRSPFFLLTDI